MVGRSLLSTGSFTLFGLTLAIFLGFRNNTSYSRFSEARPYQHT